MTKLDELYERLAAEWKEPGTRVAGYRDDMHDIEQWIAYCLRYRPIRYSEWFRRDIAAQNRESPSVRTADAPLERIRRDYIDPLR